MSSVYHCAYCLPHQAGPEANEFYQTMAMMRKNGHQKEPKTIFICRPKMAVAGDSGTTNIQFGHCSIAWHQQLPRLTSFADVFTRPSRIENYSIYISCGSNTQPYTSFRFGGVSVGLQKRMALEDSFYPKVSQ